MDTGKLGGTHASPDTTNSRLRRRNNAAANDLALGAEPAQASRHTAKQPPVAATRIKTRTNQDYWSALETVRSTTAR